MRIIVERDDQTTEVYNDVLDAYLAVRQVKTVSDPTGPPSLMLQTASFSWGPNLRELVKEVAQSLVELQDALRSMRNGSSG